MTPDTIRNLADGVQWLALVTVIGLVLLILVAGRHWPEWRKPLALLLIYGVLASLFYVAVLVNAIPAPLTSLLSALLRLYTHVLMLSVLLIVVFVSLTGEGVDGDGTGDDDS